MKLQATLLRLAGLDFPTIGRMLGIRTSTAWKLVSA